MKYYNHNHIWAKRQEAKHPIWGSYSGRCYGQVLNVVKDIKAPGSTVLDVGCGAGAFGKQWVREGYLYTGVDESDVAIELGRDSFEDIALFCADFAEPYPSYMQERAFDIVTSINVLHCLTEEQDRKMFFKNCRQALKDDGVFVMTTMCQPVLEGFRQADSPRCYKSVEEISIECQQGGFLTTEIVEFQPPEGRAKVGNLTLKAYLL